MEDLPLFIQAGGSLMQRFDCLAKECPLLGPHLLEASAGTGKTFSIEHIYTRLALESFDVEQILVVTFTKAATRELKGRIRANLEKALHFIESCDPTWEYLTPHFGSEKAVERLRDALSGFDRCQIFTIHSFCYRMLQEFAFEAGIGFSLTDPDEGKGTPNKLKIAAVDFLENGIRENILCKEQVTLLLKQFDSFDEMVERLVKSTPPEKSQTFEELFTECKAALHTLCQKIEVDKLLEDFQKLEPCYKVAVKGDFKSQVLALADLENRESFGALLRERGSLFKFLDPQNKKVRAKEPEFLHYPDFFDWAKTHIDPLLHENVFHTLQAAWAPIRAKIMDEEDKLDPDQILIFLHRAIQNEKLASSIANKYRAAIIDEFQDTDAVQWEIFQHLFLRKENPVEALYLVGDPKQSIYRFRKADVYTYLLARDFLGEGNVYQLDTNFRSSKSLIDSLNALFNRDWLHLPKANRVIPFHPVRSGAKIDSCFHDDKGAIHFTLSKGEPNALFDEVFLPFAIGEIEKLDLKNCAILVKDRYQAEKVLNALRERNIPAIAKSHTPLGETFAFQAIRELFDAVMEPRSQSSTKIVMAGPFSSPDIPFHKYKALLEEKGLVSFAKIFAKDFNRDMMQIFELLFAWEKREGFSFAGLKRTLKTLHKMSADEGSRKRMEVDEQAVQIMTLHISKGLEFDVVFALGLASRSPTSEVEVEEISAEKLRQLYVAMTRAKRRLYVPIALSESDPKIGGDSPMELFSTYLNLQELKEIATTQSITIEEISAPVLLAPPREKNGCEEQENRVLSPPPFLGSYLSSFTTLAKLEPQERAPWVENLSNEINLQTMPRGTETGIIIHSIFEKLFSSKSPIWRDFFAVEHLVKGELLFSPLKQWEEVIVKMVQKTLTQPLQIEGEWICLNELEPEQLRVEVEFLYPDPPNFVKGFIDLIFSYKETFYFVDWKTNWLENYELQSLQEAMRAHNYDLQASLYAEAIKRFTKAPYGGAFYFFVRGGTYAKIS